MPSIDIDGTRVALQDAGTGLPIVFIPGLVGTPDWFRYQASGLRGSFRVISYQVRPWTGSSPLDRLTRELTLVLDSLKLPSAVIAGHSTGAMIAQKLAASHPDRVDALVLMSAFPCLPKLPRVTLGEWLCPAPPRVESLMDRLVRRTLRKKPAPPSDDLEGRDWLAAGAFSLAARDLRAGLDQAAAFDSRQWLPTVNAPTLVIVGARDNAAFLAGAELIYETVPDSALEVVEEADHYCFFTRHDVVNGLIDDFLTDRIVSH